MNIDHIAARLQLVTVNAGLWRATRINKPESDNVNAAHGTGDAAKVMVKLTDHASLVALGKLHAAAYDEHRRITLPSVQDGMRVLPMTRQFDHQREMKKFKDQHDVLVADFLSDYETIRADAPSKLNGLYVAKQWPERSKLREKFSFTLRYLSCPTDGTWKEWMEETAKAGQLELQERLVKAARHLADVCKSDGKIYESAVLNLQEVCELAGDGFNLMDDPIIAKAARELMRPAKQSVDVLRESKSARRQTGEEVNRILGTLKLS